MPNIIAPGRPSARGAATRQKIEIAAVELVAERGWDAATTRAVAERAGVNQALIHYHFDSIDTLLRSAVVTALESEMAAATQPFAGGTLASGLVGAVEAVERFDPQSPSAILLAEAMVRAMRDPQLAEAIVGGLQAFRHLVAARVRLAASAGEVSADVSPDAAGTLVAAVLDGLLFHRIVDPSTDVASIRDVLLQLVARPAHSAQGGSI
jgi:AcrR family transcriptional regulator